MTNQAPSPVTYTRYELMFNDTDETYGLFTGLMNTNLDEDHVEDLLLVFNSELKTPPYHKWMKTHYMASAAYFTETGVLVFAKQLDAICDDVSAYLSDCSVRKIETQINDDDILYRDLYQIVVSTKEKPPVALQKTRRQKS